MSQYCSTSIHKYPQVSTSITILCQICINKIVFTCLMVRSRATREVIITSFKVVRTSRVRRGGRVYGLSPNGVCAKCYRILYINGESASTVSKHTV